jgi:hypothetical protein
MQNDNSGKHRIPAASSNGLTLDERGKFEV